MNTHQKNKDFERFKLIYRLGFGISVLILLLVKLLGLPDIFLLTTGVFHILYLVYIANKVKNINFLVMAAGNRIQTAGYLHTLIGFAAALFVLGKPGFEIGDLSIPLATKLLTSLLGWFFGGEFIAEGESDNVSLQQATTELIDQIQKYTNNLKSTNDLTLAAMKKTSESHMYQMQASHSKTLDIIQNNYANNLDKIEQLLVKHNEKMNGLYSDVEKNSKSLNEAMNYLTINTQHNSKILSDSLEESSLKISEGAAKIKTNIDKFDMISNNVEDNSKKVSGSLNVLSTSLDKFQGDINNTISSASNLTTNISTWATKTNDMTSKTTSVITHLNDLTQHIMLLTKNNKS